MNFSLKIDFIYVFIIFFIVSWSAVGSKKLPITEFHKTLSLNNYRFVVSTNSSGAIRQSVLEVYRDDESLITFRQKIDGFIVDAQLADLDNDGSLEIYFYSCSYGTGSFGKVYGFQFYPNSFAPIKTEPLTKSEAKGYMGHDSFSVEGEFMMRRFPVYNAGDANAFPTGVKRLVRYKLVTTSDNKLILKSYF